MSAPSPYASRLARVPVRAEVVEVLGVPARYWVYGEDAARTVVAVHGLRGDHHGLEPIVAHLPGVRVIVPDLPGFGTSPSLPDGTHDLAGYAGWTAAFLAAVAPGGDTVLAGHSFGSVVAAATLTRGVPARGLVLVNPIAVSALAGPRVAMTRLALLYHRLAATLPERAGTALLRSRAITRLASVAMARTADRGLRRWIHEEHDRYFNAFASRRTLLEAFEASIGHDVGEFAARVAVPALLVAAERDDISPPPTQYGLRAAFPDARLVMIPGTGHLAHYETPAAVAAEIVGFLAALPQASRS